MIWSHRASIGMLKVCDGKNICMWESSGYTSLCTDRTSSPHSWSCTKSYLWQLALTGPRLPFVQQFEPSRLAHLHALIALRSAVRHDVFKAAAQLP